MWTTAERRTTISLSPPSTPRLRREPPGSAPTPLDGRWWPRTRDPVAELPGLILALDGTRDPVTHVMLHTADWDTRPRRLRVDGPEGSRVVRLGWFDTMPAGLLTALCGHRRRIDLLVVPAHTGEPEAGAAMAPAAPTGRPPAPASPSNGTEPQDRWESEGGGLARPIRSRNHPG